jgi:PmbA protein
MMQTYQDQALWLLDEAKRLGADKADVMHVNAVDVSVSCRLGKQDNLERSESAGVGLRVWVGDAFAMVSSSHLQQESLGDLAARAVAMARVATPDPYADLVHGVSFAPEHARDDLWDAHDFSAAQMFERALEAEDAARSVDGITNSEGADVAYGAYVRTLATSAGFVGSYRATTHVLSASVIAGEGATMQRDHEYTAARHYNALMSPRDVGLRAAQKALARLHPIKKPTCKVPVVFDPRVGRGILYAFASGVNGASVARGTSFLKDRMGTQLFAKGIQITDDATRPRGLASRPFDGEGVASAPRVMVADGVVQSWLLDSRSAKQLGLHTTGHASRGMASPPSPAASNLYLHAGKFSKSALLADIEEGFYVTETFGMGVNTITGDYSQGAAGFWIEKGEIVYPVSELTIAGKLPEMFAQMTPADDLAFKYSVNTPTLRVEGMTVAGS